MDRSRSYPLGVLPPTVLVPLHPRWLLLLGLAAASSRPHPDWGEIKAWVRSEFPRVAHLEVPDLETWLADPKRPDPLLIDARARREFELSRLPGARWAPTVASALDLIEAGPPGRPVVVYCSVGYRSGALASELGERGVTDVFNLEGSLFEWANRGGALESDAGPARHVHPFDRKWGRLLSRRLWPPDW